MNRVGNLVILLLFEGNSNELTEEAKKRVIKKLMNIVVPKTIKI